MLRGAPTSGQDLTVVVLHDRPETPEPGHAVRQDAGGLGVAVLRQGPHGPALEVPDPGQVDVEHPMSIGGSVRRGLDGRQEGRLPGGPIVPLSAHVGVAQPTPWNAGAAHISRDRRHQRF